MTFVSHAQNFEDVMLWRALRHVEHGFWVDVGAADPDSLSVTLAFSERGWRDINIEPAERPFRLLQKYRPHDINLQTAAGDSVGEIQLFIVDDANGLTTTDAAIAGRHAANGYEITPASVSLTTLAEICAKYVSGPLHFLKIDVEGAEKSVILGADFTRFRPWIILVEATAPASELQTYTEWEQYLLDARYLFVYYDGLNRFYLAEEHAAGLLPHFQTPPNVFDDFVRASELTATAQLSVIEADLARAKICAATSRTAAEAAVAKAAAAEADLILARIQIAASEAAIETATTRAEAAEADLVRAWIHVAASKATVEAAMAYMAAAEARAQAEANAAATAAQDATTALTMAAALGERANALETRAHTAETKMRALIDSTSWRLMWPMRSVVYRGRKLLRHPRLSLLRRTVRHAPGPARNPGADAIPAQFESSLPEMVREELPEWNLTSIRHLDDEAVMTIRVNTVFTVAQKHFCLNAPRPDPGPAEAALDQRSAQ